MSKNFVDRATASIEAPKSRVWQAFVTPDAIKQYLFGAEVESDWSEGSAITWKGEMKGQIYQDRGVILKIEPEQILQYSHFSPRSGKPDKFENYHIITIHLFGSGNTTELLLSQHWRYFWRRQCCDATSQCIHAEADSEPAQLGR